MQFAKQEDMQFEGERPRPTDIHPNIGREAPRSDMFINCILLKWHCFERVENEFYFYVKFRVMAF